MFRNIFNVFFKKDYFNFNTRFGKYKLHAFQQTNNDQVHIALTKGDWEDLQEDTFKELFRKSAVKRTKFEGLKRNIAFLKS